MFKELIKKNTILVVGDFMLDTYWFGSVSRISPEAPVPVLKKWSSRSVAGGAANVGANLIAAGKNVTAVSVIGKDKGGEKLTELLQNMGCDCSLILKSEKRRTTEKIRILAQNNQQLLRIDEEEIEWITEEEVNKIVGKIEERIQSFNAVILSDYMKGVLSETMCRRIIDIARNNNIPVFCDVKDPKINKYKGSTLMKPNKKELNMLTGMPVSTEDEIKQACEALSIKCECTYVLATLGSRGMALYMRKTGDIEFITAESRAVYDVSGAGDTVISYLVACISSGIDIKEAVRYANKAAGIKVEKVGTATVTLDEMERNIYSENLLSQTEKKEQKKIYKLTELVKIVHSQPNKKIVFTNGCFDILHAGHVMYLQKAAEYGDILIVGVNSDESVKRLKGPTRPINSIRDRLAVLSGLQCVSYLVEFREDTPESLIKAINPNVLVKGADYKGKFIAGADWVKKNGGEVILIPILENHSTTNIVNKVGEKND